MPPVPQPGTPQATSDAATPQSSATRIPGDKQLVEQPASLSLATPRAPAPKLVIPVSEVDFGVQKKERTLTRSIAIRNGGKAELKILSVDSG